MPSYYTISLTAYGILTGIASLVLLAGYDVTYVLPVALFYLPMLAVFAFLFKLLGTQARRTRRVLTPLFRLAYSSVFLIVIVAVLWEEYAVLPEDNQFGFGLTVVLVMSLVFYVIGNICGAVTIVLEAQEPVTGASAPR